METKQTMMHVAGLLHFSIPEDASPDYLRDLFNHIKNMPDMTELDKEEQVIRLDKMSIEHHPSGFTGWEKQEKDLIEKLGYDEKNKKKILDRIKILRKWARENNMMKSKIKNIHSKENK